MNFKFPTARRATPVLPMLAFCLAVPLPVVNELKVVFKKPPLIISALESGSKARAFMVNEQ